MEWEKLLRNSVKEGKIKELHLRKVPVLKNCENWKNVEPLGFIDYKGKFTHYKGMLVLLKGNIYFVNYKTMEALSEFIRWKLNQKIEVFAE